MTMLVIGGHSRRVGKTSLASAIIASWPQYSWTAVKISTHRHEEAASHGEKDAMQGCSIHEEHDRNIAADTGRFLAAGALRSFWVRIRDGRMEEAFPKLLPILRSNPFVLIESNTIVRYIQPDLFLMVHRYDVGEYKKSARETLIRADAVVAVNSDVCDPHWNEPFPPAVSKIPVFRIADPRKLPRDLKAFISRRLAGPS